ncbi:MAG: hypothetical protein CSB19_00445 [Clostridiales bacterium]|nr:MAG: hypothetical protein CSB19_00445 [Clostridiales bacterium]
MRRFLLYSGIVSSLALFVFFIVFNYNNAMIAYYLLFITLLCTAFARTQLDERHSYYEVNRLLYELLLLYTVINGVIALHGWYSSGHRVDDLSFLFIYAVQGVIVVMALFKLYLKVSDAPGSLALFFDFVFQTVFFGALSATIIYHFYGAVWQFKQIIGAVLFISIIISIFVQLLALLALNKSAVKYHFSAYIFYAAVYIISLMAFYSYFIERVDIGVYQFLHLISLLATVLAIVFYKYNDYGRKVANGKAYGIGDLRSINFTWVIVVFLIAAYIVKIINLYQLVIFLMVMTVYQYTGYTLQFHLQKKIILAREEEVQSRVVQAADSRMQELAEVNDSLKRHMQCDALTGLLNRRYFIQLIERKIAVGQPFTLLYIDLDRFKEVNDIHGHAVGDDVLIALATRFKMLKINNAQIARLGGDEFAALIETVDREPTDIFCTRVSELISTPVRVDKLDVTMGVSIGVTRFPKDAVDSGSLLKNADVAMYRAKGLNTTKRCVYYSDSLLVNAHRQSEIDAILKNVDLDSAFDVLYRPIINFYSSEVCGVQARIDWHSEQFGKIEAAEFLPIAEKNGTIHAISDWFFINVASQIKIWSQSYDKDLKVHVLISRAILDRTQFIPSFNRVVNQLDLDASLICCELISQQMTQVSDYSTKIIGELRSQGASIGLSNFGTAKLALENLAKFDVDCINISSSIIKDIADDASQKSIALAIVKFAEGMGVSVIAEGVSNDDQLAALKAFKSANLTECIYGDYMSTAEFEARYLDR